MTSAIVILDNVCRNVRSEHPTSNEHCTWDKDDDLLEKNFAWPPSTPNENDDHTYMDKEHQMFLQSLVCILHRNFSSHLDSIDAAPLPLFYSMVPQVPTKPTTK